MNSLQPSGTYFRFDIIFVTSARRTLNNPTEILKSDYYQDNVLYDKTLD